MSKEIIFDKILRKFEGNKTFHWDYLHTKEFYEDIHIDYFVVENHLNFLIGDSVLKEDPIEKFISLSRKGHFVMTNSNTDGYQAKKKKENRKRAWAIFLGIASIVTFILVTYRFANDFIITPKSRPNSESVTVDTKKQTIPPTDTANKKNQKADSVKPKIPHN